MQQTISALYQLSRWRQHVPYTLPLVIIGALLTKQVLDWRLVALVLANVLAMTFAFMINDVVDAPDDQLDPVKRHKNVISQGMLPIQTAYRFTIVLFITSLSLFGFGGVWSFLVGLGTLTLSFLYSVKPFRLKARPIVDIISHMLMLSAFLMLSGYLAYAPSLGWNWLVIIGVTMASAHGQFYNQLDDFDVDQAAGLHNTAMLLGKRGTRWAMYASGILTVGCLAWSLWLGLFPTWLAYVLCVIVITLSLFRWDYDMRGNAVSDHAGSLQQPILIGANLLAFIWLLETLGLIGMG